MWHVRARPEQVGADRVTGEGGEGLGLDEPLCRTCHDDTDVGAQLGESARDLDDLVGRDPTGDAEDDLLALGNPRDRPSGRGCYLIPSAVRSYSTSPC